MEGDERTSLLALFQGALHWNSSRTAVIFCDRGLINSITYKQLWEMAQGISQQLKNNHMSNEFIGCLIKPGLLVPAIILGVLQVSSAFTFINLKHPSEFITTLLKYIKIKFLIVEEGTYMAFKLELTYHWNIVDDITTCHGKILLLEIKEHSNECVIINQATAAQRLSKGSEEFAGQESIAYVIQTSGTTGEPKVVQVPHQCIVPNIIHLRSLFKMTSEDVVFLASPLTFDPSVVDIFVALSSGAVLFVVPDYVKAMSQKLLQIISENHVTVLQSTPSLIQRFGKDALRKVLLSKKSSLRVLAFGGERCPTTAMLQSWRAPGNKTLFFNLYGITEVSCWATFTEIHDADIHGPEAEISLGTPLLDTHMELRNDKGEKTDAEGQLFVGGSKRWCIINDDLPSDMKATGDWVVREPDGTLVFLGRQDSVLKYNGKKFSLLPLERRLEKIPIISQHCLLYKEEETKLYIFVVTETAYSEVQTKIIKEIKQLPFVPPYQIIIVPSVPITSNGKTDKRALFDHKDNFEETLKQEKQRHLEPEEILAIISSLWQKYTRNTKMNTLQKSGNFVFDGGSSVDAVQFNAEIEWELNKCFPLLIDKILNSTYSTVVSYVLKCYNEQSTATCKLQHSDSVSKVPLTRKTIGKMDSTDFQYVHLSMQLEKQKTGGEGSRKPYETDNVIGLKNTRQRMSVANDKNFVNPLEIAKMHGNLEDNVKNFVTSSSENDCGINNNSETFIHRVIDVMPCCKVSSRCGYSLLCACSQCSSDEYNLPEFPFDSQVFCELPLTLCNNWKYNLNKCIDASPLLVQYTGGDSVVFIGSHSGEFAAIEMIEGKLFWKVQLKDRIESSACISSCGSYVLLGCYDHYLYCLHISTGELSWKFKTDAEVKSSPVVDHNNIVYCGSHDHYLYAIKVKNGQLLWKTKIGEGSIFSSPAISSVPFLIYAACLDGSFATVCPDTGKVIRSYNCRSPLFSSPLAYSGGVCVGSVSGEVFHWDHCGSIMYGCHANGPIFSSAASFTLQGKHNLGKMDSISDNNEGIFVIGSHDHNLYCFSSRLLWKFTADSSIYATPHTFIFPTFDDKRRNEFVQRTYITVASSKGSLYILDADSGKLIAHQSLPGEIFSSPVIIGKYLVVGCRDNNVYCFKIM